MTSDPCAAFRGFLGDFIQVGVLACPLPQPVLWDSERGCMPSQGHSYARPPGRERVTLLSASTRVSQPHPQTKLAPSAGLPLPWPSGSDCPGAVGREEAASRSGTFYLVPAGMGCPDCASWVPASLSPRLPLVRGRALHTGALPGPERTPEGRAWWRPGASGEGSALLSPAQPDLGLLWVACGLCPQALALPMGPRAAATSSLQPSWFAPGWRGGPRCASRAPAALLPHLPSPMRCLGGQCPSKLVARTPELLRSMEPFPLKGGLLTSPGSCGTLARW